MIANELFGAALLMMNQQTILPPTQFGPVPSARQLRWHALESSMFIHFGVNTFTGVEWGEGKESPKQFNPTQLDCAQWVKAAKSAGLNSIVITAKHHDGFCIWPSALTEHSVASSPWRGGKGDVLRELSRACADGGIGFGVYLSPWDRNNPRYGTGAEYNEYFAQQLRDVLTNYGPVCEVWFDGACGEGPNGRKQVYDFPKFIGVVRECQPNACIFSDAGPDIRWVGNESGFGGDPNWCRLNVGDFYPGIGGKNDILLHGQADGTDWLPAEVDVSIRPGWFWRESENSKVKSPQSLEKIWMESVGRSCNLLLNVPVDSRGLIGDEDVASLAAWGDARRKMFEVDLAPTTRASASSVRGGDVKGTFAATAVIDSNHSNYWATDDGVNSGAIELAFEKPTDIKAIRIEEAIELGQRVQGFTVEVRRGSEWSQVAKGETIGVRRVLPIAASGVDAIRVVIVRAAASPCISRVSIY